MRSSRVFSRRFWSLLSIWLILLVGCASAPPPPSPALRARLETIGVVAAASAPRTEFLAVARGWEAGVAADLATLPSVLRGVISGGGGRIDPIGVAAAVVATAFSLTVGGVAAGATGAWDSVPAAVAEEIDRTIRDSIGQADLPAALADAIRQSAGQREDLRRHRIIRIGRGAPDQRGDPPGALLEVQVVEAGFQGEERAEPRLALYLTARTRLLDGSTRHEHYTRDFRYASIGRPLAEWTAADGRLIAAGLQEAVADLATRILDEVFLLARFPFASGLWALPGTPQFGACWFQPLDPPHGWKSVFAITPSTPPEDFLDYPLVNSTQPVLRWEAFPRPRDAAPENEQILRSITDVSYDVKIWEAPRNYPERLVEDATGLRAPAFRPRVPLASRTKYFWTMRARYRLGGELQVTRWAYSLVPSTAPEMPAGGSCDLDAIPPSNYFRFQTP
jgi:hypothetical protein